MLEPASLPPWEALVYAALNAAANAGAVCPSNLDLEMQIGCNSGSVAPTVVKRLERRGLIAVTRYQKSREVQIIATGRRTARAQTQLTDGPHVPRGCGAGSRQPSPADRKAYRASLPEPLA